MPARRTVVAMATAALALGLLTTPGALAAGDAPGRLEAIEFPTRSGEPVSIMIELDAQPAARAYAESTGPTARSIASRVAVSRVKALQASVRRQLSRPATRAQVLFEATNAYAGIAVRTDPTRVAAIAELPGVKAVHRMVPKERDNFVAVPLIGAPAAWVNAGFTGDGVTIGIIDTGIDFTHADFGGPGTVAAYDTALAAKQAGSAPVYPDLAKVAGGYDFAGNAYDAADPDKATPAPDSNPLDCEGHGTHVAGTAAGYGVAADGTTYNGPWDDSTPFDTMTIGPGVAPEATLYALKVFGCEGSTDLVVEALDWAMDPNGDGDLSDHLDVVNMSLGSTFGSSQDPDSVASSNAVDAGVAVIAAAGNSGDIYEVTGSPASATKALSVAASEDPGQITDGFTARIGSAAAVEYPALLSNDFAWTSGVTNAPVVRLGNWSESPSESNNTDGCDALSAADAAAVAGKVALLQWNDDDVARRCGSATRSGNVFAAGAIGAILGSSEAMFSVGIAGSADIPVVLSNATGTDALSGALDAGSAVTATLTADLRNSIKLIVPPGPDDPTDTLASFTSRGTALAGNVKPDVAAPGATIFSADVGTGNEGISLSGTSMAAPVTAGVAALVRQAHPAWTSVEVKAAIMNTADHALFLDPGQTGPRYDVLRAGSGRIDAKDAVRSHAVAYVTDDPGAVSVSFGVMNLANAKVASKTVRIADKRDSGGRVAYTVSLDSINSLAGATYAVSPTSVSLAPGTHKDVTVTLTLDPTKLVHKGDPTITLDPLGLGIMRDYLTDASALLKVTPADGSPTLRVPVFAAPRPASTLSGGSSVRVSGSGALLKGKLTLTGRGVMTSGSLPQEKEVSRVSALQLVAESPQLPPCEPGISSGCWATTDDRGSDIRYLGFTSDARVVAAKGGDPLAAEDGAYAYFGVASWGPWRTASNISTFFVWIDTGNDGIPDLVLVNTRLGETDIFTAQALSVRPNELGSTIGIELLNNVDGSRDTAKMHSNVMVLPISLGALAHPTDGSGNPLTPFISEGATTVSYWVEATNADGDIIDAIGYPRIPLRVDLTAPPLTAFDAGANMPAKAATNRTFTVTLDPAKAGANPRLLLLHHLNALSKKAQVVTVAKAG